MIGALVRKHSKALNAGDLGEASVISDGREGSPELRDQDLRPFPQLDWIVASDHQLSPDIVARSAGRRTFAHMRVYVLVLECWKDIDYPLCKL